MTPGILEMQSLPADSLVSTQRVSYCKICLTTAEQGLQHMYMKYVANSNSIWVALLAFSPHSSPVAYNMKENLAERR